MGSWTISHTCLPCLPSWWVSPGCYITPFDCSNGMALVLWGVGAILGNGYGIQEQNYVAMFKRSNKNLILGI